MTSRIRKKVVELVRALRFIIYAQVFVISDSCSCLASSPPYFPKARVQITCSFNMWANFFWQNKRPPIGTSQQRMQWCVCISFSVLFRPSNFFRTQMAGLSYVMDYTDGKSVGNSTNRIIQGNNRTWIFLQQNPSVHYWEFFVGRFDEHINEGGIYIICSRSILFALAHIHFSALVISYSRLPMRE